MTPDYVIFTSFGNDSVALIAWAQESNLKNVLVVHSNTGWAADYWVERVEIGARWVRSLDFEYAETHSVGMEQLVRDKKAWPRGGGGRFQFCTEPLKKEPGRRLLDELDPDKSATILTGIMRIEGGKRLTAPEHVSESADHGGRELWCPLVRYTLEQRNALISKSPFVVLPYRSKECWPCVNATKSELANLEESRIKRIEALEIDAGVNSKGNARVMFSPARHGGAVGIRAVVNDAKHGIDDAFPVHVCSAGWCE